MEKFSTRNLSRAGSLVAVSLLLGGCIGIFDDGGEEVGEPLKGDDVQGGSGGGGLSPASGGAGSGGASSGGSGAGGLGSGGLMKGGGGIAGGGADGSGGSSPTGGSGGGGAGSGGTSVGDGGSGGGMNTGLEDWQSAALDKHNEVRALHCVPELTWNESAADFAQSWAEGLCPTMTLTHSMGSGFGENLYMSWGTGSGTNLVQSAIGAVEGWYGEIDEYNYNNPGFASGTGHFTQVVWEGSTAVGCGIATCTVSQWNVVVVSCNYSPPGNYTNQFEQNVPPLCQ